MSKNWVVETVDRTVEAALDVYKNAERVLDDFYGPPTGIHSLRGPALRDFVLDMIKAYPPQPWVTPSGQVVNASSWLIWIQQADPRLAARIRQALMPPVEESYGNPY
jgi:hypothetical protein